MYALVTDPKAANFIVAHAAPPEASIEAHTARLKLDADGTLSGDVQESYSGHSAEGHRRELGRQSDAQREQWVQDRVTRMFPGSEVTEIKIENVDDPVKPMQVHYHLRSPQYAQVTGKRILFQSLPFRRGGASPFTASDRRYPIEFPYAWREVDEVHIQLPEGWKLDNADSPGGMDFGKPGSYKVTIAISPANDLYVVRTMDFGKEGVLTFANTTYPQLKAIFDQVQLRDRHTLSLKADN
jgi:hypothetical protein